MLLLLTMKKNTGEEAGLVELAKHKFRELQEIPVEMSRRQDIRSATGEIWLDKV